MQKKLLGKLIFIVSCGLLPCSSASAEDSYLRAHDKILWIGDSITAQGLYEQYVMRTLKAIYPEAQLTDLNAGVGGATAESRFGGIEKLIDEAQPTIVTAMFGVNDTRWSPGDAAPKIEAYTGGLTKYIDLAQQRHLPLLLLRETHFSHNQAGEPFVDGMNPLLRQLFAAQDKLAAESKIPVVDVFGAYTRELEKAWQVDPRYEFTPNVIHPTMLGHSAVAGEILKAFGAGLPLATGDRGPLHLAAEQPVALAAVPQSGVAGYEKKLPVEIVAENLTDRPVEGKLIAAWDGRKFEQSLALAPRKRSTVSIELDFSAAEPSNAAGRWNVQPLYLAFVGNKQPGGTTPFAATQTPIYHSRFNGCKQPLSFAGQKWVEWEGQPAKQESPVRDLTVTGTEDSLRVEFTWKDATPVAARGETYNNRAGEPVKGPLDMTAPFGQPCDAVEIFLDPRKSADNARYTSNMDSIPSGTRRAGLYRIEENGKLVPQLQVSPASAAEEFELADLGGDKFAITWHGRVPDCGVGFNVFATDATEYAPNKFRGLYQTSVLGVGTDWLGFYRLSLTPLGNFYRVGY